MVWRAICGAWTGSWGLANGWYPFVGAPVVWLVFYLLGWPLSAPTDILGGFLLLLATLGAAWMVIFLCRLFYWPWKELGEIRVARASLQNPGNDAWEDGVRLERVHNRPFKNETVALDGRHFINPVFDDVTLFYQGTGPVFLENPTYILHGGKMGSRLATRNKVVAMALKIHHNLLRASGVKTDFFDYGPEAPFDAPDGLPNATPSVAQQSFALGVRTLVLSQMNAAIEGLLGVFHGAVHRYQPANPQHGLSEKQWSAVRSLAEFSVLNGLRDPFYVLRNAVQSGPADTTTTEETINQMLHAYSVAKETLSQLRDAAGIEFSAESLAPWHEAESRALAAIQNLAASPISTTKFPSGENALARRF